MSEDPLEKFIETMGMIAQTDGGSRISGQILGYLLIEGEPRSLQQMTAALRISKASASTNTRMLEAKGLLRRISRMGSRHDEWEAIQDLHKTILATYARRMRHNAKVISDIADTFPQDSREARQRVEGFAEFYRESAEFMEHWATRVAEANDDHQDDANSATITGD